MPNYWDLLETNQAYHAALARKMAEKTATSYPSICEDVETIIAQDCAIFLDEVKEVLSKVLNFPPLYLSYCDIGRDLFNREFNVETYGEFAENLAETAKKFPPMPELITDGFWIVMKGVCLTDAEFEEVLKKRKAEIFAALKNKQ